MTRWIAQPPGTFLCGQIAIAALADVSLVTAIAAVGHTHSTETRELVAALRKLGLSTADRCRRLRSRPALALAKVRWPDKSGWHWVVVDDEWIYDGCLPCPVEADVYDELSGRITSYLPVAR